MMMMIRESERCEASTIIYIIWLALSHDSLTKQERSRMWKGSVKQTKKTASQVARCYIN